MQTTNDYTGWCRKMVPGPSLAHSYKHGLSLCGQMFDVKKQYVEIDINDFPQHKICNKCRVEHGRIFMSD